MLTVKEFKYLGGEFVEGDVRSSKTRGHGDVIMSKELAEGTNKSDGVDHEEVISFIWRPLKTLPIKSKFDLEVNGIESLWRPLLIQPSLKSIGKVIPKDIVNTITPKVGTTLVFNHDIDGDFGFLHSEKYGWEDGDSLEVIHKTINHNGCEVFIVLNTQPDVLTTAVIDNIDFFDTRTPKQKLVDSISSRVYSEGIVVGASEEDINALIGVLYELGLIK